MQGTLLDITFNPYVSGAAFWSINFLHQLSTADNDLSEESQNPAANFRCNVTVNSCTDASRKRLSAYIIIYDYIRSKITKIAARYYHRL